MVAKKDHKSVFFFFFIAVSVAPNRALFTGQLKVRIEFITIVLQRGTEGKKLHLKITLVVFLR